MIVGFGGGGLGITRPQIETLRRLIKGMPLDAAVHRGMGGMESVLHNVIRSIYPLIPVHVLPITGVYSSVASQPLLKFPQTIIYKSDTPDVVNFYIVNSVYGIIFCPEAMFEGGPGWDLPYEAREQGVPVLYVWKDGTTKYEENGL